MSFTFAATRGPVLRLRLRLQLRLLGADAQVPTTPRKAVRKGHETKSNSAGPLSNPKTTTCSDISVAAGGAR